MLTLHRERKREREQEKEEGGRERKREWRGGGAGKRCPDECYWVSVSATDPLVNIRSEDGFRHVLVLRRSTWVHPWGGVPESICYSNIGEWKGKYEVGQGGGRREQYEKW